jgi:hypothetical protein
MRAPRVSLVPAWVSLVFASILLTSCGDLPSLEGLANKNNTVFDPALVGAWNSGDAAVIVQRGDNQSYRIHWLGAEDAESTETPRIVRMEGRLAQIGGQRILDLTASNPGAFAIPCHVFLRIRPVKDGLQIQFLDSTWIRELVKTSALASVVYDGHPVLTAPAGQIEAFLLKFGLDERALSDPILLRPLKQSR